MQREIDVKTKELRESNEEAIKALQSANDANKAKDIFLASMSHELRTPLNAIMGFSQILLSKGDTPEGIKSFLNKIFSSGKHLLELVNTILDIAKIESGKMEVYKGYFAVNDFLGEVKTLTEPMAEKKSLTLLVQIDNNMEIFADRQLIKQVIVNLLSNAIKFSPENDRIMVKFDSVDGEDIFRICDHGKGIPQDKIETIFDPFTQVRHNLSDTINGTGLGLSIVKKIIELHDGKVWVETKEGKGSCFFFSIPSQRKIEKVG
jgi:signal transduction histidine kinase